MCLVDKVNLSFKDEIRNHFEYPYTHYSLLQQVNADVEKMILGNNKCVAEDKSAVSKKQGEIVWMLHRARE